MDKLPRAMDHQFGRLKRKKDKLFELIASISMEDYTKQPFPGSWSVGQAVNHLYLSEKLSLSYLRKKMSYPDTIPPYHFKSWINMWKYRSIFRFIKAKAPKQINMWENQELIMPEELNLRWNELRDEIRSYIIDTYPLFKDRLVFNHPFAGRLTMRQMLIFFNDHIDHHTKQILTIMKKIR